MARSDQPINAEVPAAPAEEPAAPPPEPAPTRPPEQPAPSRPREQPPAETPDWPVRPHEPQPEPPQPEPKPRPEPRRRAHRPVPGALKAIAALVVVAIVFIAAAIVGGGSAPDGGSIPGAASGGEEPAGRGGPAAAVDGDGELAFPELATNNTTRVGGADPVANAAAVALAVYPSREDGQRPAAVTLVDEGDWLGAVAAAVLMAQPLGAPILISGDEVPDPSASALEALDPQGTRLAGGVQAFAVGAAAVPGGITARRVGATGASAAAAIARLRDRLFGRPPRHIVLAPAGSPELAAPAAGWAARSGDPVLFTGSSKLPEPTRDALRRHDDVPVYVLGPSSAISSQVVREVVEVGNPVKRVSGEEPVANSIALARYADGDFGWDVNDPGHGFVIARSDSPLDAAAAAPLSASGTWGPLLLTDSADTLPGALRDFLLDVKPGYTTDPTRAFYNHVWLIGDTDAIDVGQQAEIDELAELARIGGGP